MGYVDGPSECAFAGNGPINRSDPLGLYEENVHRHLTTFLAMKAGFDRKLARQIGAAAQDLDLDDGDAMHGGGANNLNMNLYYFVSPARLHGMRRDAFSGAYLDPGWLGLVGEFFHAWEDSYSHQEDPVRQDFGK